jgi:uncharacterized protein YndB with AHSA1/START domain
MNNIQTEILINTDITKVWDILINFDGYPKWNPFITSILINFNTFVEVLGKIY